jgi:DNA-directed RNA polymerase subunit RPC12/RpoP
MLAQYRRKAVIGLVVGFVVGSVGSVLQRVAQPSMQLATFAPPNENQAMLGGIASIIFMVGVGFWVWGCIRFAQAKAYHWAWGLLGIPVIGFVVLLIMPDKSARDGKIAIPKIAEITHSQEPAAPPSQTAPSEMVFACPQCHKKLRVKASMVGRSVRCPACHSLVSVPAAEPAQAGPTLPGERKEKTNLVAAWQDSAKATDLIIMLKDLGAGGAANVDAGLAQFAQAHGFTVNRKLVIARDGAVLSTSVPVTDRQEAVSLMMELKKTLRDRGIAVQ